MLHEKTSSTLPLPSSQFVYVCENATHRTQLNITTFSVFVYVNMLHHHTSYFMEHSSALPSSQFIYDVMLHIIEHSSTLPSSQFVYLIDTHRTQLDITKFSIYLCECLLHVTHIENIARYYQVLNLLCEYVIPHIPFNRTYSWTLPSSQFVYVNECYIIKFSICLCFTHRQAT
jgi:hypothetical protein